VRSLESLQRIVFLMAGTDEGISIGGRFALPDHIKEKYVLRCGVSKGSSYAIPLDLPSAPMLLASDTRSSLLMRTMEVIKAASVGAMMDLSRLIPDQAYRTRALAEVEKMAPRPGNRWAVSFAVDGDRVELDTRAYRTVNRLTTPQTPENHVMTVTGELIRVDFAKSFLTLRYRPTGREIRCECDSAVLDSILPNRDEPIQVTGRFKLGDDGHPIKLTKVNRIEPLDLSPMIFDSIEWADRRLTINPPLTLQPTMDDESGQLYVLVDHHLGIDVFARNREQLADELAEQVLFLWDTYAQEAPDRLTDSARTLREKLQGRIQESDLATT